MSAASPRIEWIGPTDAAQLGEWDDFLRDSPRGHYCQLSTWLASFRSYGFTFAVMLAREPAHGRIVGGGGVLRFGPSGLRAAVVPIGPIVDAGQEALADGLLEELVRSCRRSGSTFLQIQFPSALEAVEPAIPALIARPTIPASAEEGTLLRVGGAPSQLLWIDFGTPCDDDEWRARMLERFSKNTRRDVRASEQCGLELEAATSSESLRSAYALIEENGRRQGYSTRNWRDFGPTVEDQVRRGQGVMLVAAHQGRVLGAHYAVVAGRRYSYLMGGIPEADPTLNVGRFLHWSAMLRARRLGLDGYDLTSGGSPGVLQFKMGFRPLHVRLSPPIHFPFHPARTRLFRRGYAWAHRRKKTIAGVLSGLRRLVPRG